MIVPKPGDQLMITAAGRGQRTVTVLAVKDHLVLGEYQKPMPKLTTQLLMLNLKTLGLAPKTISYLALGTDWLQRIVDGGQVWVGNPRRHVYVPGPEAMLWRKKGGR